MRKTVTFLMMVGAAIALQTPSATATHGTSVQGSYMNYGPGGVFIGEFVGNATAQTEAAVDGEGNVSGPFDEWFYGTYRPDGTTGGLHYTGTFKITAATGVFRAQGTIIGGTCGFAGSKGSITFIGSAATGAYIADWVRPSPPVPADPTCNPIDI